MKEQGSELTPVKDPNELERNRRRVATFTVSTQVLGAAMELPEGTEIIGAEWDFACLCVRLHVRGPQFAPVCPGYLPPIVTPTITMKTDHTGRHSFIYDWGLAGGRHAPE